MLKKKLIKNIKAYLIKESDTLIIFVLSFIVIFLLVLGKCTIYNTSVFDSQAFLTWDYLASKNYMPYRDVFYPYGILYYFKNSSLFFSIIYIILLSALFTSFYKLFRQIVQNKFIVFCLFLSFVFFVLRYTGFESFGRYGIFLIFTAYYSVIFSKKIYLDKRIVLLLGALNGFIFYLLFDQVIYASIFFAGFTCLVPIKILGIGFVKRFSYYKYVAYSGCIYTLGFLLGATPFSFFAIRNGFFKEYFTSSLRMKDIFYYAKTPFFPGSLSLENLLTFLILFIAIFYLGYKVYAKKKLFNLNTYSISSIVLVLLFLEEKNIVRSNAGQLTFVAFFLLLLLFVDIYRNVKNKLFLKMFCVVVIFGGIVVFLPGRNFEYKLRSTGALGACVDESKARILNYDKDLSRAFLYIDAIKKDNENVYSFPGSPIFYVYYDSKFPYYPSTYEASPLYGQESRIKYLSEKSNKFVVVDLLQWGIQDGVPEYARAQKEFKYIFTHFRIIKKIGHYVILYRNEDVNNYESINIKENISSFDKNLLNIFLSAIPESEGIYKIKYLHSEKPIITSDSLIEINKLLKEQQIPGANLIIEITSKVPGQFGQRTLALYDSSGSVSRVLFNTTRRSNNVIIRFSNIPIFYGNAAIDKIEYSEKPVQYSLYSVSSYNNKYLW